MVKGIALTLSACFIWGLIFAIPTFLSEFSSLEIALGRYFFFGLISIVFFAAFCFRKLMQYPLKIWLKALWFSLISTIFYYTSLVLAVQYAGASITALVAGIAPITTSFYGNFKKNECSYLSLIPSTVLIFIGLIIVNIDGLFINPTFEMSYHYLIGLVCAFIALGSWTWYVIENTQFLKTNPTLTQFEWSTMLGVATFVWVIALALFLGFFIFESGHMERYFLLTDEIKVFLIGTAILGFVCSWLGSFLWNSGCTLLPVSLGGQMTIFETVFGLIFVYLIENRYPAPLECIGIILMFAAIIYSINMFTETNPELTT